MRVAASRERGTSARPSHHRLDPSPAALAGDPPSSQRKAEVSEKVDCSQ